MFLEFFIFWCIFDYILYKINPKLLKVVNFIIISFIVFAIVVPINYWRWDQIDEVWRPDFISTGFNGEEWDRRFKIPDRYGNLEYGPKKISWELNKEEKKAYLKIR